MRTLIVYELVPEATKLFLAPTNEIPPLLWNALRVAHGSFGNSCDSTGEQDKAHALIDCSMTKLADQKCTSDMAVSMGWKHHEVGEVLGFLVSFEVQAKDLPHAKGDIEAVFHLGFML